VTIASPALTDDYETPKGFYLLKICGELWLRGYWSGLRIYGVQKIDWCSIAAWGGNLLTIKLVVS
jgi:hypothetical protein